MTPGQTDHQASFPPTGIYARGVTKAFAGETALRPTDLDAEAGQLTLLVGPNGSGKTTFLRSIATLVWPDAGVLRVNGLDPVRQGNRVRRQTGLALVNERSIFWRLSVLENIELFARLRSVPKAQRRTHCVDLLDELGLSPFIKRDAFALSAGQRQRVILARAMVGDPAVLLSDEPLRGLDPDAESLVVDALAKRAAAGATVLVATPSEREFEALGHDVVMTIGGSIEGHTA